MGEEAATAEMGRTNVKAMRMNPANDERKGRCAWHLISSEVRDSKEGVSNGLDLAHLVQMRCGGREWGAGRGESRHYSSIEGKLSYVEGRVKSCRNGWEAEAVNERSMRRGGE